MGRKNKKAVPRSPPTRWARSESFSEDAAADEEIFAVRSLPLCKEDPVEEPQPAEPAIESFSLEEPQLDEPAIAAFSLEELPSDEPRSNAPLPEELPSDEPKPDEPLPDELLPDEPPTDELLHDEPAYMEAPIVDHEVLVDEGSARYDTRSVASELGPGLEINPRQG